MLKMPKKALSPADDRRFMYIHRELRFQYITTRVTDITICT